MFCFGLGENQRKWGERRRQKSEEGLESGGCFWAEGEGNGVGQGEMWEWGCFKVQGRRR